MATRTQQVCKYKGKPEEQTTYGNEIYERCHHPTFRRHDKSEERLVFHRAKGCNFSCWKYTNSVQVDLDDI